MVNIRNTVADECKRMGYTTPEKWAKLFNSITPEQQAKITKETEIMIDTAEVHGEMLWASMMQTRSDRLWQEWVS